MEIVVAYRYHKGAYTGRPDFHKYLKWRVLQKQSSIKRRYCSSSRSASALRSIAIMHPIVEK